MLITDLKHEKMVFTDWGKGGFAVPTFFVFKEAWLDTFLCFIAVKDRTIIVYNIIFIVNKSL